MLVSEGVVYPPNFFTTLLFSDVLDADFFEPDTPSSELVNPASTGLSSAGLTAVASRIDEGRAYQRRLAGPPTQAAKITGLSPGATSSGYIEVCRKRPSPSNATERRQSPKRLRREAEPLRLSAVQFSDDPSFYRWHQPITYQKGRQILKQAGIGAFRAIYVIREKGKVEIGLTLIDESRFENASRYKDRRLAVPSVDIESLFSAEDEELFRKARECDGFWTYNSEAAS